MECYIWVLFIVLLQIKLEKTYSPAFGWLSPLVGNSILNEKQILPLNSRHFFGRLLLFIRANRMQKSIPFQKRIKKAWHYIHLLNPIALRKAKILYNFGRSECNRVNKSTLQYVQTERLQTDWCPVSMSFCLC